MLFRRKYLNLNAGDHLLIYRLGSVPNFAELYNCNESIYLIRLL